MRLVRAFFTNTRQSHLQFSLRSANGCRHFFYPPRERRTPMAHAEHDLRLNILNTLLTTPHRNLARLWPIHRDMAAQDPRFYVRLAAWYADHGDVRDHKEM